MSKFNLFNGSEIFKEEHRPPNVIFRLRDLVDDIKHMPSDAVFALCGIEKDNFNVSIRVVSNNDTHVVVIDFTRVIDKSNSFALTRNHIEEIDRKFFNSPVVVNGPGGLDARIIDMICYKNENEILLVLETLK